MAEKTTTDPIAHLYQKLSLVLGKIANIPKNGYNAEQKYAFVRDADVLDMVRGLLSDAKIAFLVNMVSKEMRDAGTTKSGTAKTHYILDFDFTFADCETGCTITQRWAGESIEFSDKGLSKAATSAEKTFLLKTFMIPTGNEETDDKTITRGNERQQRKEEPAPVWPSAKLVGDLINHSIEKLQVSLNDIRLYTGIEHEDDIEAWGKFTDRKQAAMVIKDMHDKHMAELAASKPATPKSETEDPNKAALDKLDAGLEEFGVDFAKAATVLKIKDINDPAEWRQHGTTPKAIAEKVKGLLAESKSPFAGTPAPKATPETQEAWDAIESSTEKPLFGAQVATGGTQALHAATEYAKPVAVKDAVPS